MARMVAKSRSGSDNRPRTAAQNCANSRDSLLVMGLPLVSVPAVVVRRRKELRQRDAGVSATKHRLHVMAVRSASASTMRRTRGAAKANPRRDELCILLLLRHPKTSDNGRRRWPCLMRMLRPLLFTKLSFRSTVIVLLARRCAAFAGLQ